MRIPLRLVHGVHGNLSVLSGRWTLTGEISFTFEHCELENLFEGHWYQSAETFHCRWTAESQIFGKIQRCMVMHHSKDTKQVSRLAAEDELDRDLGLSRR